MFLSSRRAWDLSDAPQGALAQRAETLHRPAGKLCDTLAEVIVGGAVQELDSLRLEPDLCEQPPHRADTNLGPVVALSQAALPPGTRDDAQTMASGLQGMEEVLRVDLAAAGNLSHHHMRTVLVPLAGHAPTLGHAFLTDIHNNVRTDRLGHRDLPDIRGATPGLRCHA